MLKYKNKEGKVVMTEDAETGEVKVFDEKLKELKEPETKEAKDKEAE